MSEALMHVVCPGCEQPIDLPAQGAGQTIDCPSCGRGFEAIGMVSLSVGERTEFQKQLASKPLPSKLPNPFYGDNVGPRPEPDLRTDAEKLQGWAGNLMMGGWLGLGLSVVAGLMGLSEPAAFMVSGAAFSGAMCLFLFGHLMHIRAALAKTKE